mgnify:FL=1
MVVYGILLVIYLLIKSRLLRDDRVALMAGLAALETGRADLHDEPLGSPQIGFERDKKESLNNLLRDLSGPSEELREVAKRRFADGSAPERDIVFSLLQEGNKPELMKLAVAAAGHLRLR